MLNPPEDVVQEFLESLDAEAETWEKGTAEELAKSPDDVAQFSVKE
jgi:hypothetical protein